MRLHVREHERPSSRAASPRAARRGTWRRGLKNHRSIARSTAADAGARPSRSVSSIQFGWPGCIRSGGSRAGGSGGSRAGSSRAAGRARRRRARGTRRGAPSPGGEIVAVEHVQAGQPVDPFRRRVARHEEHGREPPAEALAEPGRRSPCRRRRGSRAGRGGRPRRAWSSSGGRGGSLAPRRARDPRGERGAVEAVEAERLGGRAARGPALDAEDGRRRRPVRARAGARRRAPPTGAWSSTTKSVLERRDLGREPVGVEAVEPRHRDDAHSDAPRSAQASRPRRAPRGASPGRTRASTASAAVAQHRPAPEPTVARRQLDPPRRGADREPDRDALRPPPRRPSAAARASRPRCRAGRSSTSGSAAEQRDVAQALVRLARAGRDQAGVVQRVDDLRALARLVVDLLVRARGEEATRRS